MADVKKSISTVQGWLTTLTEFGISIIFVAVILDILFPGSTGLITNINGIVSSFSGNGVTGLVALLLFMSIYRR